MKFILVSLLLCVFGMVVSQQNYNPDNPDYIPPFVDVDSDFYLAQGVSLEAILGTAWSKRMQGYIQGPLIYYQYAVKRYPNSYEAHIAQASYYHELGQLENSLFAYQNALRWQLSLRSKMMLDILWST